MNFFEYQDQARRNTTRLVILFALAVLLTILALYVTVFAILHLTGYLEAPRLLPWWHGGLFLIVALGTLSVVGLGSLFRMSSLREGGSAVAISLGGRPVRWDTEEPGERRLLNVVEEMAIASGVPVPEVYVLEAERGINAFAAGYSINDAAIGVTKGTLEHLNRDELQGVIAHEYSHILNGDMRLNIRLIGILFGLLVVSLTGRVIVRSMGFRGGRRSGGRGGGGGVAVVLLIGLALAVIGFIGLVMGRVIKSSVSRQREFLADAAAIQFTRNPRGLANALRKIGGYVNGSRVFDVSAEEVSHLFFSNALSASLTNSLFATHPPLQKRIKRIDPQFDGRYIQVASAVASDAAAVRESASAKVPVSALSGSGPSESPPETSAIERLTIDPASVSESVGQITPDLILYGENIVQMLPAELRRAAHESLGATAIAFGLLIDQERQHRQEQLRILRDNAAPAVFHEIWRVLPLLDEIPPRSRLPVAELLLPALRQLAKGQVEDLKTVMQALISSDDRLTIHEFALYKVIVHQLEEATGKRQHRIKYKTVSAILRDVAIALSALAAAGHGEVEGMTEAFLKGIERLPLSKAERALYSGPIASPFAELDESLDRIAITSPNVKETLIDAFAHCALADGQVTVPEAELIRAFAVIIDCPLPPFVPRVSVG